MMSQMSDGAAPEERTGVSTLELFFDLVFVFTITQLTSVLAHETSWKGLLQVTLMLGVIFWMYGGYAWLTNAVALDRLTRRLTLLGGMAGFLVLSLAIPQAFTGSGATFGLAYLVIVSIHIGMFARSSRMTVVQAVLGLLPFNLSTALLVVLGGVLGGDLQYVLWAAAFVGEWISPMFFDDSGFEIAPGHFVERHGLVVIVAIGESVVAVGIGAGGLPVDAALVVAAVLGLALSACLWWSYFGSDEGAAEAAMDRAPMAERPWLAVKAFGYWHLFLLLGVIAMATGLKQAIGDDFDPLTSRYALALGGGAAVFLLGEALFRRELGLAGARGRAVAALLALATIPLGTEVAAAAQNGALVALFIAMLATQQETARPSPPG
jgi:low temperature requirement protein LtrA